MIMEIINKEPKKYNRHFNQHGRWYKTVSNPINYSEILNQLSEDVDGCVERLTKGKVNEQWTKEINLAFHFVTNIFLSLHKCILFSMIQMLPKSLEEGSI